MPDLANPVIVQSDLTVLLEVDNPLFPEARDALARFAELEKSPEHIHTYRISNISLWNAIASGLTPDELVALLDKYSKFPLPEGETNESWFRHQCEVGLIRRYGEGKVTTFEELRQLDQKMHQLETSERNTLLHKTARSYGLSNANAKEMTEAIKAIYDATGGGGGRHGGFGGPPPGGPGGPRRR